MEARPRHGCERPVKSLAQIRAMADGFGAVGDTDIVAHALNLTMGLVVDPRQALEFRVKIRPLLQRFRFTQTHIDGMPEIGRSGIRSVDVAVKFGRGILRFDLTNQSEGLAPVPPGFLRQSED